jgi:MoaA/NifB/PqqE/SkfB family radical SAM enzyme
MGHCFVPYKPEYSLSETLIRSGVILQATATVASHLIRRTNAKFAASVEVTDRCNAGCNFCYVYDPEWDQNQRMKGYMNLTTEEHKLKEKQVFKTLDRLKREGIIHVTLVGGDPALAPKILQPAAELFPIV